MDEFKNDDVSPALHAAIALHEMFTTLVAAGFSEKQALYIVSEAVKNIGTN